MKGTIFVLSIIGMVAFGCGCSKVDSNDLNNNVPYYQVYSVTYYKAGNTTSCAAHYLVRNGSGTRVELGNGSSVTMNGASPSTSLIDKTIYEWNGPGFFDASFILTKPSGKTIGNVVRRSDIGDINFVSLPDTVSKAAGFSFGWTGSTLGADEKIVVRVSTLGSGVNDQNISGSTVTVAPSALADFPAGKLTVQLIRVKEIPVQVPDSTAGGTTSIFYNNSKEIELVP